MIWQTCKKLFKVFLKTLMRIFVSLVSFFMILGIVGWCLFKSTKKTVPIPEKNGVLYVKMEGKLVNEQTSFLGKNEPEVIFNRVYEIFDRAADDERIAGLVLDFDRFSGGLGDLSDLLSCLQKFKEKGKFITCYADCYGTGEYLLASCADEIILSPAGMLSHRGFIHGLFYFKDFFDKMGVSCDVFKVGEYKSAIEPYTTNKRSDEDRQQVREFLEGWDKFYVSSISKNRNLPFDEVKNNLDIALFKSAKTLQQENLITKVENFEISRYVKKISTDKKKYKVVQAKDYWNSPKKSKNRKKVAILPLCGSIDLREKSLNAKKVRKAFDRIKKNKDIKAVVLKIDSPGGSCLESEKIYEEIKNFSEEIPVVVYIPDTAASGGYYISCGCDTIIASPTCLTGSIGIFSLIANFTKLQDKLGLAYDAEKTGPHFGFGTFRNFTDEEKKLFQNLIEEGYDLFLTRVSESRRKTKTEVDRVARGRVWLGSAAEEVGLVDEVGFMDVAVKKAAEKANLEKYDVCFSSLDLWESIELILSYASLDEKIFGSILENNLVANQVKDLLCNKQQKVANNPQLLAYYPFEKMEI